MDSSELEGLLYQSESETLDFKREPYPFAGATDVQKAEMLKDILGFANAWRDAPAHILLGVNEKPGKSEVVGCEEADHIDDADLRQFVNSKTNSDIELRHETVAYKGKVVGVITIDPQERPFYLKKQYCFLKPEAVYVRRGSSTNRDAAELEEVAKMGAYHATPRADVVVGFSGGQDDNSPLTSEWEIEAKAQILCPPPRKDLPDGTSPPMNSREYLGTLNLNYYRAAADWYALHSGYFPLPIKIRNAGGVPLTKVRLQLSATSHSIRMATFESECKPDWPREQIQRIVHIPQALLGNDLRSLTWEAPLLRYTDTFQNIQPELTIPVTPFGIVLSNSIPFEIEYKIFANELRSSVTGKLSLNVQTPAGIKEWGVEEFVRLVTSFGHAPATLLTSIQPHPL